MNESERVAMTIMAQIREQDTAAFKRWEAYNFVQQGEGKDWFGNTFRGALGFQVKGTKLQYGKVHIQLDWLDTYRLMFIDQDDAKIDEWKNGIPPCEVVEGIYFDQLVEVIERRVMNKLSDTSDKILTAIFGADFTSLKAWNLSKIIQFRKGVDKSGKPHNGGIAFDLEGGYFAMILLVGEDRYKLVVLMRERDENGNIVTLLDKGDLEALEVIREIDRLTSGDPDAGLGRMIENLKARLE